MSMMADYQVKVSAYVTCPREGVRQYQDDLEKKVREASQSSESSSVFHNAQVSIQEDIPDERLQSTKHVADSTRPTGDQVGMVWRQV